MSGFSTLAYLPAGNVRQRLDVFTPAAQDSLRTAVLVVHGGALRYGDRSAVHLRCQALAHAGITALAVGYRLLDEVAWPAPLDDVEAVVRWAAEHASELGVDRIVLQGHSAGAQLALLAAARHDSASTVNGVVAYYPPAAVSLTPAPGELPAQLLFGGAATAADAAAASPLDHINDRFPPTVLIHGAADRFVPPAASVRLLEALTAAGVRSELHLFAGQDHEFDMTPRYGAITTELVVAFLRAEIVQPELVAQEVIDANPFATMPPPEFDSAQVRR